MKASFRLTSRGKVFAQTQYQQCRLTLFYLKGKICIYHNHDQQATQQKGAAETMQQPQAQQGQVNCNESGRGRSRGRGEAEDDKH